MGRRVDHECMGAFLILTFLVLVGPLSLFVGVDSRTYRDSDRRGRWL
jgi:hypothetical protein